MKYYAEGKGSKYIPVNAIYKLFSANMLNKSNGMLDLAADSIMQIAMLHPTCMNDENNITLIFKIKNQILDSDSETDQDDKINKLIIGMFNYGFMQGVQKEREKNRSKTNQAQYSYSINKNHCEVEKIHYRAFNSLTDDGNEIIRAIPTFLLMRTDGFETDTLIRFLKIMESEISKGNSFDAEFLKDCRYLLDDWTSSIGGIEKHYVEQLKKWSHKFEAIENQNILNFHRNNSVGTEGNHYVNR